MNRLDQAYQNYDAHFDKSPSREDFGSFEAFSLAVDEWLCEFHRLFNRVYIAETLANMADEVVS